MILGCRGATDIRAEMDEGECALGQVLAMVEIRLSTQPAKLVTTDSNEKAITRQLFRGHGAYRFQPASNSAAALAGALPPTTAPSRYDQRRETRVTTRDFGDNIEGLRRGSLHVNNDGNFRTLLCLRLKPFRFCARNL